MYTNVVCGDSSSVLFIEVSLFQGLLVRGFPLYIYLLPIITLCVDVCDVHVPACFQVVCRSTRRLAMWSVTIRRLIAGWWTSFL